MEPPRQSDTATNRHAMVAINNHNYIIPFHLLSLLSIHIKLKGRLEYGGESPPCHLFIS